MKMFNFATTLAAVTAVAAEYLNNLGASVSPSPMGYEPIVFPSASPTNGTVPEYSPAGVDFAIVLITAMVAAAVVASGVAAYKAGYFNCAKLFANNAANQGVDLELGSPNNKKESLLQPGA